MAKTARPSELFIFGAGAAKPYDVPTWDELKGILLNHIDTAHPSSSNKDRYQLTDEIKDDLKEIVRDADEKKYGTIDKSIAEHMKLKYESSEKADIMERIIFDLIMQCMKDFEIQAERDASTASIGWVGHLLRVDKRIAEKSCFINFNYDASFPNEMRRYVKHFAEKREQAIEQQKKRIEARYTHVDRKKNSRVREKYAQAISSLKTGGPHDFELEFLQNEKFCKGNFYSRVFFPHGLFSFGHNSVGDLVDEEHRKTYADVAPEDGAPIVRKGFSANAVSCYNADKGFFVFEKIEKANIVAENLYVIGVGGGLEINLDKIDIDKMGVKKVFYTCTDPKEKKRYENYFRLRLGEVEMRRFKNCDTFLKEYKKISKNWK